MGTVVGATVMWPDGNAETVGPELDPLRGVDGGLVELKYSFGPDLIPSPLPGEVGMWRYRQLLPLDPGPIMYPLAVGGTPLVASPGLRADSRVPALYIKDETRSPTGSNKDRATALVLEHAMRGGVSAVTAASTGNVAVSLAVGAAAAGLQAMIFVPAEVGEGKLRLMLLAGATVFRVEEGYEAAFNLSRRAARAFGWYDRNTGVNPLTLEGKKTAAFEIWEQLGRHMPDVVLVPTGDGTSLTAMTKGFCELVECGVADRVPRIVGVQAEGCQPLKRAWERNEPLGPTTIETLADGIAVDVPINGVTALRDVRFTAGAFVAVSDESILQAITTLAARGGVLAEPAAAAGYAGLEPALEAGFIRPDETVVVHITGTGLKTPQYLRPTGASYRIRADLAEVERTLSRTE